MEAEKLQRAKHTLRKDSIGSTEKEKESDIKGLEGSG